MSISSRLAAIAETAQSDRRFSADAARALVKSTLALAEPNTRHGVLGAQYTEKLLNSLDPAAVATIRHSRLEKSTMTSYRTTILSGARRF
jgi:hypothetical protein